VFLLIYGAGCFALVLMATVQYVLLCVYNRLEHSEEKIRKCYKCFSIIIILFLLGWAGAGMYWVYSDFGCQDCNEYAAWPEGFYMSLAIFISVYLAVVTGCGFCCHRQMVKSAS
jgi:cytochrome bd-type quinol oxidase subunit 2